MSLLLLLGHFLDRASSGEPAASAESRTIASQRLSLKAEPLGDVLEPSAPRRTSGGESPGLADEPSKLDAPDSTVEGHLFDHSGLPVPYRQLSFEPDGGPGATVFTDKDGAFSVTVDGSGLLQAWLGAEGGSWMTSVLLDEFSFERGSSIVRDLYVLDSALVGTVAIRIESGSELFQVPEDGSENWYDYTLKRSTDGLTVAYGQLRSVDIAQVEARLSQRELLGVIGLEEAAHAEPGPEFFLDLRERLDAVRAAGGVGPIMDLNLPGLLPDYYTLNVQLAKLIYEDYTTGEETSTWIEGEFSIDFTRDGDPRRVWVIDAAQAEAEANERLHDR